MTRSRLDDSDKRARARARAERGDWSLRVVRSRAEAEELDVEEAARLSAVERFLKVFELSARFYGFETTVPRRDWPVRRMNLHSCEGSELD